MYVNIRLQSSSGSIWVTVKLAAWDSDLACTSEVERVTDLKVHTVECMQLHVMPFLLGSDT